MTHEHLNPFSSPFVSQPVLNAMENIARHPNEIAPAQRTAPSSLPVADMFLSGGVKHIVRPRIASLPRPSEPVYAKDWDAFQPAGAPSGHAQNDTIKNSGIVKRQAVSKVMPSFGILDALLQNDTVSDILVNGTESIYVDTGGELIDSGLRFTTEDEVWEIVETIMRVMGQQWDPAHPMLDTRLPDGSRVNIVAPPMAADGVNISIRKFPQQHITLYSMVASGQMIPEIASFLRMIIAGRLNVIIAGGTGSGKTTLLNALSSAIGEKDRIVTIEDAAELRLQQPHVVRLEAKSSVHQQARSAVTIRDLVKNALRMRPDRIIVGESRGEEAFDVLQAMNTGHDGSMTSLHANSPRDALGRLETMITLAMPHLTSRTVRTQIASTLHVIIQVNRFKDGLRRISHISEVAGIEGDTIVVQDLIVFRDAEKGQAAEYKWVAGSSRNPVISQAAQQAGLMRTFR
jgi:pilus assembly protein CpaF